MSRMRKLLPVLAMSLLLEVTSVAAHDRPGFIEDEEPQGWKMAADLLIARPFGVVATLGGSALFVLALPFAAAAGDVSTPAHYLVEQPAEFTFHRPMGVGVWD